LWPAGSLILGRWVGISENVCGRALPIDPLNNKPAVAQPIFLGIAIGPAVHRLRPPFWGCGVRCDLESPSLPPRGLQVGDSSGAETLSGGDNFDFGVIEPASVRGLRRVLRGRWMVGQPRYAGCSPSQTLLAYGMNGGELPVPYGAPVAAHRCGQFYTEGHAL
jgi:hypothetical protein